MSPSSFYLMARWLRRSMEGVCGTINVPVSQLVQVLVQLL